MEQHVYILARKKAKTDRKMYFYLPCYYYFVSVIINIIINLNILDKGIFSPLGNQHQVNINFCSNIIGIITLKNEKVILYYADSLYQ